MRNPLRRYYGGGDLHFITFSCYHRQPLLDTPQARDCFIKILEQVRSRFGFQLVGYVVMPEHVHLLISEPKTANPSKVLQVLKQNVSLQLREIAPLEPKSAAPTHLWQRRFYDFNVWSSKKRKIGIHARQSGEATVGRASKGLAVEQLVLLREG